MLSDYNDTTSNKLFDYLANIIDTKETLLIPPEKHEEFNNLLIPFNQICLEGITFQLDKTDDRAVNMVTWFM